MTPLELYHTQPRSLLRKTVDDFDDAQWHELAVYLGSYQRNAYDSAVMQHVLPIIGDRVLWLNTTSAQQFLYTAIFHNDAQMVDFILNTFEHVRNGKGVIEGWEGYVETAVQEKLNHTDWSYAVLDRLLQTFDNRYGLGLLRCVQKNNIEVLRYILPHSDPSDDCFFAYRWAQVYGLAEIETVLDPVSDKLMALFGYRFDPWVESNDKQRAQHAADRLEQTILSGAYDHEPLSALYRLGCIGSIEHSKLLNVGGDERVRLALLWSDTHPSLAQEVLKSVDVVDDEFSHSVTRCFRDHPQIVIPRLSEHKREAELYNCAHHPEHKNFAQHLVEAGVDSQQVLERLMEHRNTPVHPAFAQWGTTRSTAVEVLQGWISEWQAQKIYTAMGAVEGVSTTSKL